MNKTGLRIKMPVAALLFPLVLMLVCAFPRSSGAEVPVNNTFVYYIYWSGIRAGKAVLDINNSSDSTTISTRATSASFISLFYKVDDRAQSTIRPGGYPSKFVLKVHEGYHRRHKITIFEDNGHGIPQRVIFNNVLDEDIMEVVLEEPAYDPLSGFYEMTKRDLIPGKSEYIDVFDNGKLWHTEVKVLKKEKIRVIAGEFDTVLVKPLLKSEGLFQKTGDMYLWLTDDDKKIPVLFESKAKIGKFTVMLAEENN